MNKIARKLVLSVLTVVLTVIALGTTTFAWFTLTNTAQVQSFQAQIVADTGIEIAIGEADLGATAYGLNWVTTLTTAAVNTYIADAYNNQFRFTHVTSANGRSFFTLGLDGEGNPITSTNATSGYLELPIHFRSSTSDRIIWTQAALSSIAENWTSPVAFTDVDGTPVVNGGTVSIDASNAMRIAIQGTVEGNQNNVVAYEKAAGGRNYNVPNSVTPQDLSNGGIIGDNGAMNFYYESTNTLPGGIQTVSVVETLKTLTSTPTVLDMIEDADAGAVYYGKIMVRVYIEGWDPNAFNSILDRIITASLRFEGSNIPVVPEP